MNEWEQVQAKPKFQALPHDKQRKVADDFFGRKIAPNVPQEHQQGAYEDFMGRSGFPPGEPGLETMPFGIEAVGDAAGQMGGSRRGMEGPAMAAISALTPRTMGQMAMMGLSGAPLEAAGEAIGAATKPVIGAVSRGLGRGAAALTGKLSGLSGQGVEEVAGTPGIARNAIKSFFSKVQTIFDDVAQKHLKTGVDSAVSDLGREVGNFEDQYAAHLRSLSPEGPGGFSGGPHGVTSNFNELRRLPVEKLNEDLTNLLTQTGLDLPKDSRLALKSGRMNFGELLKLKRDIGELVHKWGPMLGEGEKGIFNAQLIQKYREVNNLITESIPESDSALNPFSGMRESARKVWRDVNDRVSNAYTKRLELYREAIGPTQERTESRIASSLSGRNWRQNVERARILGPKAEQALEESKNIVLTKRADSLIPEHGHGSYAWWLGITGGLGALVGGAETGNRKLEAAGIGILGATSPLIVANMARAAGLSPEAVSSIASSFASNGDASAAFVNSFSVFAA